ncbi:DNA replication/repair protein RecF [soil metagenome]
MRIERLNLAGFRNYAALEVEFPAGPQVIAGPNAAGKTNLIEALAVLGSGRSHRGASDAEMIGWLASFARLEAAVSAPGETGNPASSSTTIEVVLARPGPESGAGGSTGGSAGGSAGGRKRIKVNGVPRRASGLPAALPAVLFSPEDMLLVVGSPSLRRTALDGLVVQLQPAAGSAMATYGRALVQRNNLLRAVRDGLADPAELGFWNDQICLEGGRIVDWRRATLAEMAEPLAAAHREIGPGEGRLELRYLSNAEPQAGEDATAALRRRLAETAQKELWNGATLVGPHRDDLGFELDGRELSGFASRGQQRSAILAFKLGQLAVLRDSLGRAPLLLLDDVFSELDPMRRAHLVRRIGELPQAFITTTTLDDLDPALVAASTAWAADAGHLERSERALAR